MDQNLKTTFHSCSRCTREVVLSNFCGICNSFFCEKCFNITHVKENNKCSTICGFCSKTMVYIKHCYHCGNSICSNCATEISHDGTKIICKKCMKQIECSLCNKGACCLITCNECNENVCQRCIIKCTMCRTGICKECIEVHSGICIDCRKKTCSNCSNCGTFYCNEHIAGCECNCKGKFCETCMMKNHKLYDKTARFEICHSDSCIIHTDICEICQSNRCIINENKLSFRCSKCMDSYINITVCKDHNNLNLIEIYEKTNSSKYKNHCKTCGLYFCNQHSNILCNNCNYITCLKHKNNGDCDYCCGVMKILDGYLINPLCLIVIEYFKENLTFVLKNQDFNCPMVN